jgi:hypothetical protein
LAGRTSRGKLLPLPSAPDGGCGLPALFGGEPMASLLAACRQDFPAALGLHARAETVRLRPAPPARLICALWQSNPPF